MEKSTIKPVETNDQAIRRLAALAKERGIQVFSYPRTNEFYATSRSHPEMLHRVTAVSCDCEGFFAYQRCTHFAALLAHIGELPPTDPSAVADPIPEERQHQDVPSPKPTEISTALNARLEAQRKRDELYPPYGLTLQRIQREHAEREATAASVSIAS